MKAYWEQTRLAGESVDVEKQELELGADNWRVEMQVVNVYDKVEDQVFEGLGGAATEAAAYVYACMPEEKQREMLSYYFGEGSANYQFLRVSLDSCDFALGHYEAMSDPDDRKLVSFSLERDHKYVIPFLRDCEEAAGHKLQLMLSPWSPPAFMKDTKERNHGGKLLPEYRALWADYMVRYVQEYKALGFQVKWLTVQNECNAVQTWDSCNYTGAEEREFVHNYLRPAMREAGLDDVSLLVWDHNKERVYERALESITEETMDEIDGMAFHWYTGDHFEGLDLVRKAFPGKQLIYSEGCVEFCRFDPADLTRHGRMYAHEYLGDLKHGCTALIDWNMFLDEQGGPNHVRNFCAAPVMCHLADGSIHTQLSAHFLIAIGKHIRPGAVRLETSAYTDALDAVAFRNPDGTIALLLLNKSASDLPVQLRLAGRFARATVAANALAAVTFEG